jgi:uncharacterized protein YbcV (DUF1398 family)
LFPAILSNQPKINCFEKESRFLLAVGNLMIYNYTNMRGQNINIYLPYTTFIKVENLIKKRKISSFINQAILKEINEQEKQQQQNFEKSMIAAYQRVANNQEIQTEMQDWEEADGDGLDNYQ